MRAFLYNGIEEELMRKRSCIFIFLFIVLLSLSACQNKEEAIKEEITEETSVTEEAIESGIPSVYIRLDEEEGLSKINGSEDHTYEISGSFDLIVPEGYEDLQSVKDLKLEYMRGRGNSTWLADKKPYKIKFEKKQDLLNSGFNKHYVLLANAYDRSFIKNRLTSYIAEKMGMEYVCDGVNVDLYVDEEYLGNYLLCEQVRIGEGRIELDELKDADTAPEIYGGYLLSFSPWAEDEEENIFVTSRGVSFYNDTPGFVGEDKDAGTTRQKEYIRDYIQRCEDAIFEQSDVYYGDLLDMISTADYWLIQEFSENSDGFKTPSTYCYTKRFETDGSEGKLYLGPLWDFDRAFGDTGFGDGDTAYFNHVRHDWINELRDKEEFCDLLKERWKLLDQVLADVCKDGGILDRWKKENEASFIKDQERWKDFYAMNEGEELSSQNAIFEDLKDWIGKRRKWINEDLEEIGKILAKITIVYPDGEEKRVKMAYGSFLYEEIGKYVPEGSVLEGCYDDKEQRIIENASIHQDETIHLILQKAE